jgi:hypothetical protein
MFVCTVTFGTVFALICSNKIFVSLDSGVMPVQAGIHTTKAKWIPAFAGMTATPFVSDTKFPK